MIDFFINILMYLIIILGMIKYFKRLNIYSFIIVLFNLNAFFLFMYLEINFIYGLIICLISILLYEFFKFFSKESKDIILIQNGNINFKEVINQYSYFKLVNYLKRHRLMLSEIAYCIKRDNHLIIIKSEEVSGYPVSLILDGKIMKENLRLIQKDENWLKEELLNNHQLVNQINYAYYKNNQVYFIVN